MNMKYIIVSLSLVLLITGVICSQDKPAAKSDLPDGGDATKTKKTNYSADDLYQLTPEMKAGDKFEVEQKQEWKGKLTMNIGGKESPYDFEKSIENKYKEDIVSTDETVETERTYETSQSKKSGLPTSDPNDSVKKEDTSLKGRKIGLKIKDNKITESKVISKEEDMILSRDVPYITPFNEFDVFISPTSVKVGDSWKIREADFGKIIFSDDYDAELCSLLLGEAKFEEIVDYKGSTCAKISVKITTAREKSDDVPKATVDLTGTCYFDLDKKIVNSVELKGTFTLNKENTLEDKTKVSIKVESNITITSEVKKVAE